MQSADTKAAKGFPQTAQKAGLCATVLSPTSLKAIGGNF